MDDAYCERLGCNVDNVDETFVEGDVEFIEETELSCDNDGVLYDVDEDDRDGIVDDKVGVVDDIDISFANSLCLSSRI